MSVMLRLGVNDVPYGSSRQPQRPRSGPQPAPARATGSVTTGDVAVILEAQYSIMEKFVELYRDQIENAVARAMQDKLEILSLGGPVDPSEPLLSAGSLDEVEQLFRKMLDDGQLDGLVPGVPTQAALRGVSHRMARPYARRAARPSFVDTGAYSANFRAWVEES